MPQLATGDPTIVTKHWNPNCEEYCLNAIFVQNGIIWLNEDQYIISDITVNSVTSKTYNAMLVLIDNN